MSTFVVGAPPYARGLTRSHTRTTSGIDPLTIMSLVGAAAPLLEQLAATGLIPQMPGAPQAQQTVKRAEQQLKGVDLSKLTQTLAKQRSELDAVGDLVSRAAKRGGRVTTPDVATVVEERSKGLLGPDLAGIVATLNKAEAEGVDVAQVAKTLGATSKSKEVRSLANLITAIDQGRIPEHKVIALADEIVKVGAGGATPQAAKVGIQSDVGPSVAEGLAGLLGTRDRDPVSVLVSLLTGDGKGGGLADIITKLLPGTGVPGVTKAALPAATPGVPGIDLSKLLSSNESAGLQQLLQLIQGVAKTPVVSGGTIGWGRAASIVAQSLAPVQRTAPTTAGVRHSVQSTSMRTVGGVAQTVQTPMYAYAYPNGYTVGLDPMTILSLVNAAGPLLGGQAAPGAAPGGQDVLGNLLGGLLGGAVPPGVGALPGIGSLVNTATKQAAHTIDTVVKEGAIPLPLGLKLPLNPLDNFDDVGQVFAGKPAKTPLGLAASVVKTVADPIIGIFEGIGDFFGGLFKKKPCRFDEKGPCAHELSNLGLMYGTGNMDCCAPVATGRGVLITGHTPGYKKFPGGYFELAAGDYFTLACGPQHADRITPLEFRAIDPVTGNEMGPCSPHAIGGISGFIVPESFKIQAFSGSLDGDQRAMGPGVHPADGLNDRVFSARVRGPWTFYDSLAVLGLRERVKGWITAEMRREPTVEECVALVLADPQRPVPPEDFSTPVPPYTSFWSEGWRDRLAELGLLETPQVQAMLRSMGVSTGVVRKAAQTPEEELAQLLLKVLGKRKVKFTTRGAVPGSADIPIYRAGWGGLCYPGAISPLGCQSIGAMALTADQPYSSELVHPRQYGPSMLVRNDARLNAPAGTVYL